MDNVISIRFKGSRRLYYSNPMEYPFRVGDYAVVEVEKGEDIGLVTQRDFKIADNVMVTDLLIRRKAGIEDIKRMHENRAKEKGAIIVCRKKVEEHALDMKVTDVEYQMDRKKLTFFFTADQRVDFRALVKDLAAIYRTRIDLRQIGPRDEAKRHDGCGVCGLRLCCSSWLASFEPVNTQMAKEQDLPINPSRLAGICGRLKCCLRFEYQFYYESIASFPEVGSRFMTERGEAVVAKLDIFQELVYFRYEDDSWEMQPLAELNKDDSSREKD